MKTKTSRILLLILMICMMFTLAACGGKDAGNKTDLPAPEAVVDPEEMNWGYQAADIMDTQYWYPNGDKSASSFIFFEDDYLTTVDGETRTRSNTEIADKHIVDAESGGTAFDFVFPDIFTCYDLVSKQYYLRADYDAVVSSLTSSTFVCEDDSECTFSFAADGTFSYTDAGETASGTWWFENARTIYYKFDDESNSIWFEITYADDSWDIISIRDLDTFYPES